MTMKRQTMKTLVCRLQCLYEDFGMQVIVFVWSRCDRNDHTTVTAPLLPVCSAKLSTVGPGQYYGGGPRWNPWCCSFAPFAFRFGPCPCPCPCLQYKYKVTLYCTYYPHLSFLLLGLSLSASSTKRSGGRIALHLREVRDEEADSGCIVVADCIACLIAGQCHLQSSRRI